MATTSEQIVLRLVAGMFGAPPGKDYLATLVAQVNASGIQKLAIDLGDSPFFKSLYPTDQGGHVFANAFLTAFVPGFSLDNPAHLWALNWMADQFDHGVPAGQVVLQALQALYALPADNATWGAAHAQWDQLTDLAATFSASAASSGLTPGELRDALHAPVFDSAVADGAVVTLHYNDLNGLDATNGPAASTFAVTVSGVARTVQSVAVDAAANTVKLTLATAVYHGEKVTVAYTEPTAGDDTLAIQDKFGNDAPSLAVTTATNNTADVPDTDGPVLLGGVVNGNTLVLNYTDASDLDPTHIPAPGDFKVMVDSVQDTVTNVLVNSTTKTVYLLLADEVTDSQAVTVAYKDPSTQDDTDALQDVLGNDAATFAATKVTNTSADSTGPEFDSAVIQGDTLVMTYTDSSNLLADFGPRANTFTVKVDGVDDAVTGVSVNAAAKTVTLTLADEALIGQAVTVAYADPTPDDDSRAIQDEVGNDAASLPATKVTNESLDKQGPVFANASVNGSTLVMTYTDLTTLDANASHAPLATAFTVKVGGVADVVTAVAVNAGAKTVALTLTKAVAEAQGVTVAYADASTSNDTRAIQDSLGNDAASLTATAVANYTPAAGDVTPPVFASAAVDGDTLVMTYTEATTLDPAHVPAAGAFTVKMNGSLDTVTNVVVDAAGKTVTLTLATAAIAGKTVTVSYADPTAGNDTAAIQDSSGNDAASLSSTSVTNNTVAPVSIDLVGVMHHELFLP